jgi:hypothetical protein
MARIFVGGREIEVQDGQMSVEELRQAAGIPPNRALIRQHYSGANTMLPRRGYVTVNRGDHYRDAPIAKRGFPINMTVLKDDVCALSYAYEVALDDDCRHLFVKNFNLPPGYNFSTIPALLQVPRDYPESPPGVGGSHLFLPRGLRYQGRKLLDFHEEVGPPDDSDKYWGWWCYERIDWDPCQDDLITFFELLRTDMTNPR